MPATLMVREGEDDLLGEQIGVDSIKLSKVVLHGFDLPLHFDGILVGPSFIFDNAVKHLLCFGSSIVF